MTRKLTFALCLVHAVAAAHVAVASNLEIPITPFSNMASGYQATNPGFRAILRGADGSFLAGGPLTIDAVIEGQSSDATAGSPYGELTLDVNMTEVANTVASGSQQGLLSICMPQDQTVAMDATVCQDLSAANLETGRPFQWLNEPVTFTNNNGTLTITQYSGDTGEGGTAQQIALAVLHPAYGFSAPGKLFKDYQSPLVLDLKHTGKLELMSPWSKTREVRFDMTGMGQKTRTGWASPSEGLLFVDDGSGCVQDGTQLFGEYTGSTDGKKTFANGFEALKATVGADKSGRIITSKHPELMIWRNWGADGVCRPSEVYPASKYVKELRLDYTTSTDKALNADNEVRLLGHYVDAKGNLQLMGDVWFKQRREGVAQKVTSNPKRILGSTNISSSTPISISDMSGLRSYATGNNYFLTNNLTNGMKVYYSASYGIGAEDGQASGTLVQDGAHLWFVQDANPTEQLLLPPGLPFNAPQTQHSLWDLADYVQVVNRVAFSAPNDASTSSDDVYGAPQANLVDFTGGTAGGTISYTGAMQVMFQKTVGDQSSSNLNVYYAKGIGPVALEFEESMQPTGTFKIYIGQQ